MREKQNQKNPPELELLGAVIERVELAADNPESGYLANVQFYSGAPVQRMDYWTGEKYTLTLSMDPAHCNLSRLNSGAPFLNNHSSYALSSVIGVVEKASIENGKGKAAIRFSKRADVDAIRADVNDGILRNVSVGASIKKLKDITPEDSKTKSYLAIDWEPMEISAVPIGADAGAGFLSHQIVEPEIEGATAQKEDTMLTPEQQAAADLAAANTAAINTAALAAAELAATNRERARVAAINTACAKFSALPADFATTQISTGATIEATNAAILEKLAAHTQTDPTRPNGAATAGADARERLALCAENALMHRVDPSTKLEAGREFAHMSLLEMGRAFVEASTGQKLRGMSKAELAGILLRPTQDRSFQTFAPGYAGTTDYPNILANVFNKTLRSAYQAEPQTFKPLGKRGTAPDFKQMNRIQIGDVATMKQVGANGEFSYVLNGDAKEVYSLATYGQIVAINRQTLINDDLGALTRMPESIGRSAARLESDVFWSIPLANANMGDGNALFVAAAHSNYTSAGTVISVASLGVGRQQLRKQTGLGGIGTLNLSPRYLVVPPELETVAQQYTTQTTIIYTKSSDYNPFANSLLVVPEPRLSNGVGSTAGSATAWYLFAEPGMIDTIEYSYLEGQEGVFMDTRMGFDVDGMELKGRLDFAAKALDWRGMYKNAGA